MSDRYEGEPLHLWWLRRSICDPYLTGITEDSIKRVAARRAHYLEALQDAE